MSPDVISAEQIQLQWKNPDIEGIVEFLCRERNFEWIIFLQLFVTFLNFSENRVRFSLAKLKKFKVNGVQVKFALFLQIIFKN